VICRLFVPTIMRVAPGGICPRSPPAPPGGSGGGGGIGGAPFQPVLHCGADALVRAGLPGPAPPVEEKPLRAPEGPRCPLEPKSRRRRRPPRTSGGLQPGIVADRIAPPVKRLPALTVRRVGDAATGAAFCARIYRLFGRYTPNSEWRKPLPGRARRQAVRQNTRAAVPLDGARERPPGNPFRLESARSQLGVSFSPAWRLRR
jgi:hypothetical protein